MLDVGWSELMVIGVVALIVIGPKDLPEMFRTLGRFTAKMRSMARDFQRAMDDAARETGVSDIAKDLKAATSPKSLGLDAVKNAATKFEKWDPLKPARPAAPLTPAPAATTMPAIGPATQAQADAKAQKAAIAREASARMKAVPDTPAPDAPAPEGAETAAPKPARKPRAPKAPATGKMTAKVAEPAAPGPARAPGRRRKKADESE